MPRLVEGYLPMTNWSADTEAGYPTPHPPPPPEDAAGAHAAEERRMAHVAGGWGMGEQGLGSGGWSGFSSLAEAAHLCMARQSV